MPKIKKTILSLAVVFCAVVFFSSPGFVSEEEEAIKISDQAINNYGIKTIKVDKNAIVSLPRSAFAMSKDEYFAYGRKKDEFIQIDVHGLKVENGRFTFLNNYDVEEFVIDGAKYLRVIFLSQQNPSSGHVH